jgi:hypothetical protein
VTRDETVLLFEACEAKRAAARAEGLGEDEAHERAKAHWNAWVEGLLARKKALEEAGCWKASSKYGRRPENAETKA